MVLEFEVWMIQKEGVERFLREIQQRVWWQLKMIRLLVLFYVDMMEEGGVSIMSVWMKHTACAESEKAMVVFAMEALKTEGINNVSLIAFTKNDIGNAFWKEIGWKKREDLNYYDFILNEANITAFIQ